MRSGSDTHWWTDVFTALNEAQSPDEVFSEAFSIIRDLGFEWFCYAIQFPIDVHLASIEVFDCFPPAWTSHYVEREYISHDPAIRLCVDNDMPVVWSDAVFAGERAAQIWADARDFNLRVGFSQSAWSHGVLGVMSAARSSERIEATELVELTPKLRWLADNLHRRMRGLVGPRALDSEVLGRLSDREVEILGWTADGKTSWEIGQILGITERTVNFHISNTLLKLRSQNKVHAAVKALSLGLVVPNHSVLALRLRRGAPVNVEV